MKKYKIIFADLDDTLIETISGNTFPKGIWDMKIKFNVLDKIKKLNPDYILVVSNQGGIEKGFVDEAHFLTKIDYLVSSIKEYCNCKCTIHYCKYNDSNNYYRKPNIGLLESITEFYVGDDFNHIKSKSLMIGDASGKEGQWSDTDKKTAKNFGIDYIDVEDFVNSDGEELESKIIYNLNNVKEINI